MLQEGIQRIGERSSHRTLLHMCRGGPCPQLTDHEKEASAALRCLAKPWRQALDRLIRSGASNSSATPSSSSSPNPSTTSMAANLRHVLCSWRQMAEFRGVGDDDALLIDHALQHLAQQKEGEHIVCM